MKTLLILALLSCPQTELVDWDSIEDMDWSALMCYKAATLRCEELYKESPCLVRFEKGSVELSYYATCGARR